MLYHDSIDILFARISEKTEALAEELSEKQLVFNYAQNFCRLLRDLQNDNFDGKWCIGKIDSFYFFHIQKDINLHSNQRLF
ncbi:hypothetical protein SAMN04488542_104131 [Fontibacillus panacisegetis]|uniref:Uncharacterized protein n=1 Tax=Fontibacillus panacisegetis TaxID=670482 RepID=A0A1G7HFL6_9BACL|nr:hypothetical protein SAMN04488542_104131 [Fontibacillus panacisegetis]